MPFYKAVTFNRQKSIGNYIVDFYCHQFRLVIEIDGDSHGQPLTQTRDIERTDFLNSKGLTILRFTNAEVENNIEAVMMKTEEFIEKGKSPQPPS
jgi:very-short-patch-repair endonuclease